MEKPSKGGREVGAVRLRRPTRCVAPSRRVGLFGAGERACAEAERLTIFRDFKVTQSQLKVYIRDLLANYLISLSFSFLIWKMRDIVLPRRIARGVQ